MQGPEQDQKGHLKNSHLPKLAGRVNAVFGWASFVIST